MSNNSGEEDLSNEDLIERCLYKRTLLNRFSQCNLLTMSNNRITINHRPSLRSLRLFKRKLTTLYNFESYYPQPGVNGKYGNLANKL